MKIKTILAFAICLIIVLTAGCADNDEYVTGREKLADGLCTFTEFVFPEVGTSVYTGKTDKADKMELSFQEEMVNFYSSSGVQPVIYDLTGEPVKTQEELQAFADDFYENGLFSNAAVNNIYDEGHFLIVFQADGDSYKVAYHVGTNAAQVFAPTKESTISGTDIFDNCLSDAFKNESGADIFKKAFKEAAYKIMGDTKK